jgi:hypothetical protein
MNINVTYDASCNNAPAGFKACVQAAVNYYDTTFTSPITINIDVGYGEVDGDASSLQTVGGDLGRSQFPFGPAVSYAQLRAALIAQGAPGAVNLPTSAPTGNTLDMSRAEAKALGLFTDNSSTIDGYIGISTTASFNFNPNGAPVAGEYDLVGVVEHEISEDMGRLSLLGPFNEYAPIDLYRYTAPGARSFTPGGKGSTTYFSVDNGTTNLGSWNNEISNGDLTDWYPQGPAPGGNDSYNDFSNPGVNNVVSTSDLILMEALGWATAGPTAASVTASAANHATIVNAGQVVTINVTMNAPVTVTNTPTLQLNNNEVAVYVGGSGTNTLNFTYAVLPSDNIADLHVTGLNLPAGATIQSLTFENITGSVTGDLGLAVNTTTVLPTSVQQEALGLYAALYNRAAEFPGYTFWIGTVAQQPDGVGVTIANAGSTAVTLNDAAVLGQAFINTQSTYFNSVYGSLTDSAFINALYVNIGGNAGDPGGIAYWASILTQNEAGGQTVQAARAGLAGQFVHDLIDVNLATFTTLTPAQLTAAEQRQAVIDNKIAVSLAYSNASQGPGGAILDPQTIGDAAYVAATAILQAVTYDPATVTAAITGINLAVAAQNLHLI